MRSHIQFSLPLEGRRRIYTSKIRGGGLALIASAILFANIAFAASYPPLVRNSSGQLQNLQSGDSAKLPNVTGSVQCLHADSAGALTGTASDCGTVTVTASPASGNLAKFSGATTITNGDISGDCTTSGTLAITCTKTSGVAFGTFATQNYATPPAIGATTPNTGKFSALQDTGIATGTQCVHADASGNLTGTGSDCGGSSATGANPTATAGDTAINGSATTFMRSDAAPAIQKGSSSTFGIFKVDGSTVTETGGVLSATAGGGSVGATVLLSEVVTSGSQASVTFSSIPATYRDLEIRVRGRLTPAGNDASITLQFNSDTGNNYDFEQLFGGASSASAVQLNAQSSISTVQIAAGTATANFAGSMAINIMNYRDTTFFKSVFSQGHDFFSTGLRSMITAGQWRSTAAINAIKVSGGNFVDGSVVSLYGRY